MKETNSYIRSGWRMREHPNGWVYFSHRKRGLVTDADLRDEETLRSAEQFLAAVGPQPPGPLPNCDVVYEYMADDCLYYVNHDKKVVLTSDPLSPKRNAEISWCDRESFLRLNTRHIIFTEVSFAP